MVALCQALSTVLRTGQRLLGHKQLTKYTAVMYATVSLNKRVKGQLSAWVGVGSEDRGFTGSVGASPKKALV